MKGLLLKDWYMIAKYNRIFLLVLLVISAMLYFDGNTCFFAIYLCVLTGTLPVSALSYDDREKWCAYCQTMPVTRAEYVGGKYILGCLFAAAAVALSALPLLVYQGAIALLAMLLGNFLPAEAIAEVSATGSLLIIGLGFNMLGFSKARIRVGNMLPAIFLPAVYLVVHSLL